MSLLHRLYYAVKPAIPWQARMAVRRVRARRLRARNAERWPILASAAVKPARWPGWPEGRQFAFVITHDVEGQSGWDKTPALVAIEQRLGFRSSFNFVPEGEYAVDPDYLLHLRREGFEYGVHDLHHDGSLYASQASFMRQAPRIRHYLKAWGARGFRAGFMFHNLDWLQELEAEYDLSTFDTDPFEPQPDEAGTIFPFWVPDAKRAGRGYVEMPYTLPQDSTLFLSLREKDPRIWLEKLDWVAKHGGLALVNVHPDYIHFAEEDRADRTYPLSHYTRLLEHVKQRHGDRAWCALPSDIADHLKAGMKAANHQS